MENLEMFGGTASDNMSPEAIIFMAIIIFVIAIFVEKSE